ncbi:MAG: ShlB/FhaC/HecB family hemolysin secretion/activation protein [Pseudomonadota bacterium]
MLHTKFVPFALLALSHAVAMAQTPGAAGQFQQIPPAPVIPKAAPEVRIEQGKAPAAPDDKVKIRVNALLVTGARAYSAADLLVLTGFKPGSELSMAELLGMTAKIADRYHRAGYFLAQAYLPAQDIKDGVVTVAVSEGTYGKISVRNRAGVSNKLLDSQLAGLNTGDTVTRAPLDNRLLLLSDLPGVTISSTLVPGASVGSSDLIVDVTPGRKISGNIEADNAGSRYTGQYRIGSTVNLNQPLGLGDVATLRTLTSGKGLNYARASYQLQLGKAKVGVAYSKLKYELIKEFTPLRAHGTADVASIYGAYPLLRSRDTNLNAQLAYDDKSFHDRLDLTGAVGDKSARVLMASLVGDHRDGIGGGGASNFALTWSSGRLDLETPSLRTIDAATARSNGHYNKFGFSASRVQFLGERWSLSAAVNGQIASNNLDVSEKMELGGMHAVRAYPEGEAYADQGYVMSLEARYLVPQFSPSQRSQLQALAFVDNGSVRRDKNPWTSGDNSRTLRGAGVGLVWSKANDFMVRAYYARKLGSETANAAPDRSGRFWVQAVKYF